MEKKLLLCSYKKIFSKIDNISKCEIKNYASQLKLKAETIQNCF